MRYLNTFTYMYIHKTVVLHTIYRCSYTFYMLMHMYVHVCVYTCIMYMYLYMYVSAHPLSFWLGVAAGSLKFFRSDRGFLGVARGVVPTALTDLPGCVALGFSASEHTLTHRICTHKYDIISACTVVYSLKPN